MKIRTLISMLLIVFLKHFTFKTSSVFSNLYAAPILPLPVQVIPPQGDEDYGAQAVNPEEAIMTTQQLRRSRRIAQRNAAQEGIT